MYQFVPEIPKGQRTQKWRGGDEPVHGRAHVMYEARLRQRQGPGRPPDRGSGLVNANGTAGTRERNRGRKPVGAGPDNDGIQRRTAGAVCHRLKSMSWTQRKRVLTIFHLVWS
jgi:hypothetical protein